jgi:transcriptional regulator with XRE-family HTH domain
MTTTFSFPARLKAARKAAGYATAIAFRKKYNIPVATFSQYETGRRMPDDDTLQRYAKLLGVNFEWLKFGNGAPYSNQKENSSKNKTIKEEMLDLKQGTYKIKVSEALLADILQPLFELQKNKKANAATLAKEAAAIYNDIIEIETDPTKQAKLVKLAIAALKRHL